MNELYSQLAEILEVDEVNPTDNLRDFEAWDSLGVLSIIAMLDSSFGVHVSARDLNQAQTAGDIQKLIDDRQASR
jgi:acyl carrier protein